MGEARGAALAAIAEAGLDIYEIATRKVKQAIVGYGAAQKLAVAKMVQRMLHLAELPAPDAADALALALAHAQENGRYNLTPPKAEMKNEKHPTSNIQRPNINCGAGFIELMFVMLNVECFPFSHDHLSPRQTRRSAAHASRRGRQRRRLRSADSAVVVRQTAAARPRR